MIINKNDNITDNEKNRFCFITLTPFLFNNAIITNKSLRIIITTNIKAVKNENFHFKDQYEMS
ncbi:hypothetical protein KKB18_05650 [bacterium]|nr:hypothetical protein [bacterium]